MAKHDTVLLGLLKHMIHTIHSTLRDIKFSPDPGGVEDVSERVVSDFS